MFPRLDAIIAATQTCQRTLRQQNDAHFDLIAAGGPQHATFGAYQRYAAALEACREADAHLGKLVATYLAVQAIAEREATHK